MLRTGLLCLIAVAVVAGAPSQDHSIQKRQTTVTFTSKYEDIREVFVNVVVAFAFAAVAVLVLMPLLGYKIDVVVAAAEDLINPPEDAAAPTGYEEPAGYTAPGGYSRALKHGLVELGARVYNSIDVVESALDYMSVEEEACRFKAVCLAERAAVANPLASLAINTINSKLSGLSRYAAAVEAGLNGEDCHLLYDQCNQPISFF